MKSILLSFAGVSLSSAMAMAAATPTTCPNFTGTYVTQSTYGTVTIVATATACTSVDFLVTYVGTNGATSSTNYANQTDGVLRKVGSSGVVDEYMSVHYEGNELYSLAVWDQNAAPTPLITSSTDIFTLDASGNLDDSVTSVNTLGVTTTTLTVYTREGGE